MKKKPVEKKTKRKIPTIEKQELQINALIESNHEFFGLAELDGTITYINRAGRIMCGLPADGKLSRMSIIEFVPEMYRPVFQKEIFPAVQRDGRWQGEAVLRRLSDNAEISIDISVFIVFHPKTKKPLSLATVIRDISEHKKSEEALIQSEGWFRALFESATDGIFLLDSLGAIAALNESFAKMHGYTVEEMLRMNLKDLDTPETAQQAPARLQRLFAGEPLTFMVEHYNKNRKIIPIEVSANLVNVGGEKYIVGFHRDITERKRAEEVRCESEERFRKLFEYHSAVKLVIDPNTGKIADANKAAAEFYGWPIEQLKQMNIQQINTLPADVVKCEMEKAKSSKRFRSEFRHRRADGSIRDVEVYSNKIEIRGTSLLHSIIHDITERKRAEELLATERRRLSYILEGTNVGTWEWNIQTGATIFNERWAEIIGYTLEELAPVSIDTWTKFAHPDDLKKSSEQLEKHFKGELDYYMSEARMKHKSGNWVWVLDRGRVHKWDDEGKPLLMSGTHQDITEHMQAAEKIKESEERYKRITDGLTDYLYTVKVKDGKAVETIHSEACLAVTGYSSKEFAADPYLWINMVVPEEREAVAGRFLKILEGKNFPPFEHRIICKDGNIRWVSDTAIPKYNSNGVLVSYDGVIKDITESKQAEEALRANEKRLYELNVLQGILLYPNPIEQKLKLITETIIRIVGADFARIWMIKPGDRCETGCIHAQVTEEPHVCRFHDRCLHLLASSGRYTHTDGKDHGRVPFGCYKIGKIAAGEELKFLTNEVTTDPRVHNHAWAKELGLVSFAGYRLADTDGAPLGVLALFSRQAISVEEDLFLQGIAYVTSQVQHSARALEALRESEERLRKAQAIAHVGNWELDLQSEKMWASEEAFRIYGFQRTTEFLPLALVQQGALPEYRSGLDLALHALIMDKREYDQKYKIKRADNGEERFIHSWAELVFDQQGTPIKVNGVVQDITDRIQAEEALIRSEKRFRQLSDLLPQTIFESDLKGNLTFVNQYGYKSFGYIPEDFDKGQNFFTMIAPEDHQRVRENMHKVLSGKELSGREYLAQRKDGTTFPIFLHTAAIVESGVPMGIRGIAVDITDRKQAEEALRRNEEYYRSLIEKSNDLITVMDSQGIVSYASPSIEIILGYTPEEYIGKNGFETVHLDDLPGSNASEEALKVFSTPNTNQPLIVLRVRHKDGSWRYLEVLGRTTLNPSGQLVFVTTSRDITERKQADEAIKKTEQIYRQAIIEAGGVPYQAEWTNEHYIFLGDGIERVTGYTSGEMSRQVFASRMRKVQSYGPFKELPHDERVRMSRKGLIKEWRADYLFERKDGTPIWLADHSVPVFDRAGNVIGSLGILIDITEQKQVEESLRSAEENYRLIFENATIGIFQSTIDGTFLKVNPAMAAMFGYASSEEMVSTVNDIAGQMYVNPADRILFMDSLSQHNEISDFICENYRKDGRRIWTQKNARTVKNKTGQILFYEGFIADITERKRAEEAKAEEAVRRQILFDQAKDGIVVLAEGQRVVEANQSFVNMLGYSMEEVSQLHAWEWDVNFPTKELMLKQWSEIPTGPRIIETRHRRKDGSIYDVEISWNPVEWKGQKQLYCVCRDITERKRAEEALRESEEKFATIFKAASGSMMLSSLPDGKTLEVNDNFFLITGYSREEALGKTTADLNMWSNPQARDCFLLLLRQNGFVRNFEADLNHKSGTIHNGLISGHIITLQGKKYIISTFYDITERKQTEEALRESEERFRTTLYSIGDGVITSDTKGMIRQLNHVAEVLTGWTEIEACGKPIEEVFKIFNEDTTTPAENPIAAVLEKGRVVELANHTVLEARDGIRRPIADSGAPIRNSKGEITGVVLVFNDQTERRGLQDQLLQAQKMDAIGRLAGGVAHDFNNMIGVILGYAMMLEKKFDPADPSYKKIKSIISAAERSANLTKQLLAFARKQIITPVPLNLNEELSTLQKMLGRLIGEDIALKVNLQKDLWNIKIDPTQITQILTNLATNARDAIADTGSVTIETSNTKIGKTTEPGTTNIPLGEYTLLVFSDTGRGMEKEVLSHIFEPFFTTKPKGEGIGLGLSTVFGIVKQNNGFINVYSEPGQGTTIKIYFPHYFGAIETASEQPQGITLTGTETILIVEDEAELLNLAMSALEMQGYKVLGAQYPSEALSLCEMYGHKIDLLITDVVMPGMNGKELKDRIEAMQPSMKSIFMSGYTADIVANRGILEEGVQFIQKPFTPALLSRKVREVLNG